MSQKNPRQLPAQSGFIRDLALRAKLILRLMGDRRVNLFLKILPFGSLIYLFFPDVLIGPFDDALILWISTTLFVELCPQEVVNEHLGLLENSISDSEVKTDGSASDVIDGHFQIFEDQPKSGESS